MDLEHDLVGKFLVVIQNVFYCSNEDDKPYYFLWLLVGIYIIPF